jgi:nucleoredoxin
VYFSAHWCPPCRGFTPQLKEAYETLKANDVEVIFVSGDQDANAAFSYFSNDHGDWYLVPHGSDESNELNSICQVSGIPTLALFDEAGKLVTTEARSYISSKNYSKIFNSGSAGNASHCAPRGGG